MKTENTQQVHRRSWRNLLLDARYQLRFTLFMVLVCAVFMGALGWKVRQEAQSATKLAIKHHETNAMVARQSAEDEAQEKVEKETLEEMRPVLDAERDVNFQLVVVGNSLRAAEVSIDDIDGRALLEKGDAPTEATMDAIDARATAEKAPFEERVGALTAQMTLLQAKLRLVEKDKDTIKRGAEAKGKRAAEEAGHRVDVVAGREVARLKLRKTVLEGLLIAVGVILCAGLFFYGIRMTHRVAGPLYKITLYLDKVRKGKYETIYPLRKGDHLVVFYEHFRAAHEALRRREQLDVERLRALVAAAEKEGVAEKSQKLAARLGEIKDILAKKEQSLG